MYTRLRPGTMPKTVVKPAIRNDRRVVEQGDYHVLAYAPAQSASSNSSNPLIGRMIVGNHSRWHRNHDSGLYEIVESDKVMPEYYYFRRFNSHTVPANSVISSRKELMGEMEKERLIPAHNGVIQPLLGFIGVGFQHLDDLVFYCQSSRVVPNIVTSLKHD